MEKVECLDSLQEAKKSLLSGAGVSPRQLAGAGQTSRVRTIARKTDVALRQVECQESVEHQTTSGANFTSRRHGCGVAHDEERWYPGKRAPSSMETWSLFGHHAWKLSDRLSGTAETCGLGRETCWAIGGGGAAIEAGQFRRVFWPAVVRTVLCIQMVVFVFLF